MMAENCTAAQILAPAASWPMQWLLRVAGRAPLCAGGGGSDHSKGLCSAGEERALCVGGKVTYSSKQINK